jgi:hypothetical protein
MFIAKNRYLYYFGMVFFPTVSYGLFTTNPLNDF